MIRVGDIIKDEDGKYEVIAVDLLKNENGMEYLRIKKRVIERYDILP